MESHLLQMRGLKLYQNDFHQLVSKVASFTDAWIETLGRGCPGLVVTVASFTDAWIETPIAHFKDILKVVASFTDAWIETG